VRFYNFAQVWWSRSHPESYSAEITVKLYFFFCKDGEVTVPRHCLENQFPPQLFLGNTHISLSFTFHLSSPVLSPLLLCFTSRPFCCSVAIATSIWSPAVDGGRRLMREKKTTVTWERVLGYLGPTFFFLLCVYLKLYLVVAWPTFEWGIGPFQMLMFLFLNFMYSKPYRGSYYYLLFYDIVIPFPILRWDLNLNNIGDPSGCTNLVKETCYFLHFIYSDLISLTQTYLPLRPSQTSLLKLFLFWSMGRLAYGMSCCMIPRSMSTKFYLFLVKNQDYQSGIHIYLIKWLQEKEIWE
jgi:hypothetical protein